MLGTTSETLSRRLRDFKDKGIIELSGQRGIKIINFNKLEEI
jgi:CRP-like cAMP-binding protein